MPAFQYQAIDSQGKQSQGVIEADGQRHARQLLKAQGLIALSCDPTQAQDTKQTRTRTPMSSAERMLFVRQLASLLQARLPLEQALNALLAQFPKPAIAQVLGNIRSQVLSGHSLSQALSLQGNTFPAEMVAMVAAGEQSGSLAMVLENWADYLEQRSELKNHIVSSLAYPMIVAIVALLMVIGMMTYVVPQIVGVFQNAKTSLPWLTQMMMAASSFVRQYGLWCVLLCAVAAVAGQIMLRKPKVRHVWHQFLLRQPLLGGLIQITQTERFASTLSILMRGGVPILQALEASKRTLSNSVFTQDIETVMVKVREGSTLSRAIEAGQKDKDPKHRMAPILTHLIASGEATGRLPEMLSRAAQLLEKELRRNLQWLTTILEPLIILVMGGVVLLIVLSVLLPIIEINQLVR